MQMSLRGRLFALGAFARATGGGREDRAILWSFSSIGSTHAEDLIRSIGRADLIANTLNETKRGEKCVHAFG